MKALLLCTSDPSGDPRPKRMAGRLRALGWHVDLLSHALRHGFPCDTHYELPLRRRGPVGRLGTLAGMLSPWRERAIARRFGHTDAMRRLGEGRWQLVVVEDIYLLPLAFRIAPGARIVMDAREYYPRVDEASLRFRLFQKRELVWLCREYLPRCAAVLTVSDGLADAYRAEFGVAPVVVLSVPEAQRHPVISVDPGAVRIVHHGVANRDRKLENLLAIAAGLDERYSLDLYLTGDRGYVDGLSRRLPPRARILPPVPFADIGAMLNGYDIGLFYVEPTTFNLEHCMPNKLFEFIQARLAVAIGPSPDMAALVRAHRCGVVADEFSVDGMARALNALDAPAIEALKRASDRAAGMLNWEVEGRKLDAILDPGVRPKGPTP